MVTVTGRGPHPRWNNQIKSVMRFKGSRSCRVRSFSETAPCVFFCPFGCYLLTLALEIKSKKIQKVFLEKHLIVVVVVVVVVVVFPEYTPPPPPPKFNKSPLKNGWLVPDDPASFWCKVVTFQGTQTRWEKPSREYSFGVRRIDLRCFETKTLLTFGLSPFPAIVTTRIISCLVGDSYKPLFATITGKGDNPS